MANTTIARKQSDSSNQLKNIVEQSLAMLRENEASKVEKCQKWLPLHVDAANREKVALVSAAKALASLWKIQPAKLSSRPPMTMFRQLKFTNGA